MKIEFDLNDVQNNSPAACKREQTRMLLLCWAMRLLGEEAWCSNPSNEIRRSSRWPRLMHLIEPPGKPDALVVSERNRRRERGAMRVIFKTSINCSEDGGLLNRCDVLVAHENDPKYNDHPNLLPVPFMCSNVVIGQFFDDDCIESYVRDDLTAIRGLYASPKTRRVGHVGSGMYGRKDWALLMPEWCEWRWVEGEYDHPNRLAPGDYLRWLSSCCVGVFMAGDTPKSYRWSELALLGVPIVCVSQPVPITPPVSPSNAIMLKWWDDHGTLERGLENLASYRDAADDAYRKGWSVMGQARQIASRLLRKVASRSTKESKKSKPLIARSLLS